LKNVFARSSQDPSGTQQAGVGLENKEEDTASNSNDNNEKQDHGNAKSSPLMVLLSCSSDAHVNWPSRLRGVNDTVVRQVSELVLLDR